MTWSKLSDDFADDCETLSDKAFRLHVEGLCWSNRKLLDLRIPKSHLRKFATHPEVAAELVDEGFWRDDGDLYVIRHHARYQRNREDVIRQQEVNRKNASKPRPTREVAKPALPPSDSLNDSLSDSSSERDRPRTALDTKGSSTNGIDGVFASLDPKYDHPMFRNRAENLLRTKPVEQVRAEVVRFADNKFQQRPDVEVFT